MIPSHLRLAAAFTLLFGGCAGDPSPTPPGPSTARAPESAAGPDSLSATLFLIGDGGTVSSERDLILAHVGRSADSMRALGPSLSAAIVHLGDNVYDEGIRSERRAEDSEILVEQVRLGGGGAGVPIYFLPGNHDWGDSDDAEEGVRTLTLQADAIDALATASDRQARLVPGPGCPGPVSIDLGEAARLLLIDTEWMIRQPDSCLGRTRADVLGDLRTLMREARDRPVVVLTHHPLASGGPHGSGAGWVRRAWRKLTDPPQDLGSTRYDAMVDDILATAGSVDLPRLLVASGHEHSLQVIDLEKNGVPFVQLVSGSVAKQTGVEPVPGTRFSASRPGYMRVDFGGGRMFLTVLTLDRGANEVSAAWRGELLADLPPETPRPPS